MNNVVFFGQSDAGKSTLAGYITTKQSNYIKLSRYISDMRKADSQADVSLAYSSLMNTNKDEQSDKKHATRTAHYRKVDSSPFCMTIIDTPGAERFSKQRERGIFYGDVGVFCMEIENVLNAKYSIETLAPLALWSRLKDKKVIFALTKFDTANYEEDKYIEAKANVQAICDQIGFDVDITIIPTAIEVGKLKMLSDSELDKADLGDNIICSSQKMPWYKGNSLIDAIKDGFHELYQKDMEEPLLFCITDQVERPESSVGRVWTVKILSGIINVGQEICLAPVKDSNNNLCSITAVVKELRREVSRYDKKEAMECARKGELCGLNIKDCVLGKRRYEKGEINAVASTSGFSTGVRYLMSDFFWIKIEEKDKENFRHGSNMHLIWFGRALVFVIKKTNLTEGTVLCQLKTTQIAMPLFKDTLYEPVVVRGGKDMDFYDCKLIQIGLDE